MRKIKVIFRLIISKTYYVYTDGYRSINAMKVDDMRKIEWDAKTLYDEALQQDANLTEIKNILQV